jgi:hypothetical protein
MTIVMKKSNLILTIIGFLFLSIFYNFVIYSPVFFETSSPNAVYKVILNGHKQRPIWFTSSVYYSVLKNDKHFISEKYLHSGDAFDISFELKYKGNNWLDENTLHFYQQHFSTENADLFKLVNDSDKIIKYIEIWSEDTFLLFDLKPQAKKILPNSIPKGDDKHIYVEGEFIDGKHFQDSKIFDSPVNKNYKITITKSNKLEITKF